jgi:hypothetical protein
MNNQKQLRQMAGEGELHGGVASTMKYYEGSTKGEAGVVKISKAPLSYLTHVIRSMQYRMRYCRASYFTHASAKEGTKVST